MANSLLSSRVAPVAVALALVSLGASAVVASDHQDSPKNTDDEAADIADLYAWHMGGNLVLGLSFAGYTLRGMPATYDADVLYGLHIDTDLDAVADHDIWVRFGQDDAGNWGVQVENLPGVDTPIIGPVDTDLDSGDGRRVFAGLRDDPFFFDLEGFRDSAMTGEIVFDAQRDFALFQNATMIVVQLPMTSLANGGSTRFRVWATSARK